MAEGLLNNLYGNIYEAYSAGTHPSIVNPYAIEVMKEIDIDISKHRSKSINEFKEKAFDYVITVCDHARQTRPFFPNGKKYIHKSFEDPVQFAGNDNEKLNAFRDARDGIKEWLEHVFTPEKTRRQNGKTF
jgi:arsenate reductase